MEITDNTKTLANALAEIEILRKQLEDIPEGCTVADAKKLREANHALALENFELKKKLEAADAEIKRLESAWHVETLNSKDQLIAEQEAENDRLKQIIRDAREQKPVAVVDIMFGGRPEIRFLPGNYDYRGLMYAEPLPTPKPEVK
jgi:regulator of replication initiation timing